MIVVLAWWCLVYDVQVRDAGLMKPGVLGGGRLGSTLGYVHEKVRGDLMTWVNGDEPQVDWAALPAYGKKVGPRKAN